MKIKNLIKILKELDQDRNIIVSCDEELNALYNEFEICELEGEDRYCLFPFGECEE